VASSGVRGAANGATVVTAPPWRRLAPARSPTGIRPGLLLLVPLCAGALFLILPLVALAVRAVGDQGLSGFIDVIGSDLFVDAVKRTLVLSLVVSVICAVIGTAYALALVSLPRRFAYVLLAVLLGSFWLSVLVRTFGWVILFQPNGALDQLLRKVGLIDGSLDLLQTTPAMYPAMVHVMLSFVVLPVYAACLRLDPDLLRAGQSLGAPPISVIRHVVLPRLRPAILAGASLVFMLSLAFYVTPLLIGGPSELTIATLIDREFNELFDLANAARMALILLLVVLVIFLVVDRFVSLIPQTEE